MPIRRARALCSCSGPAGRCPPRTFYDQHLSAREHGRASPSEEGHRLRARCSGRHRNSPCDSPRVC
eukprot:1455135-Alexandrium_andersonii.AAC.1